MVFHTIGIGSPGSGTSGPQVAVAAVNTKGRSTGPARLEITVEGGKFYFSRGSMTL